jgi:hypothetical protein
MLRAYFAASQTLTTPTQDARDSAMGYCNRAGVASHVSETQCVWFELLGEWLHGMAYVLAACMYGIGDVACLPCLASYCRRYDSPT